MNREIKWRDSKGKFINGHAGYRDEANPQWKGDKAGYTSIHEWLYVRFGKPRKCEMCRTETAKKYEWANISKLYRRLREDWIRLCVSCHRKFDGHTYKRWETIRKQNHA